MIRFVCVVGVLSSLVLSGVVQAAPARSDPRLAAQVELRGARSASIDVVAAQAFSISPHLFDPPAELFSATRAGSGFALQLLTGGVYRPTLFGIAAPEGTRQRSLIYPYGPDGEGGDAFMSLRYPPGRYRLSLFTTGPTVVRFKLRLPGNRTLKAAPARAADIRMQLLTTDGPSRLGAVLGATKPRLPDDTYTLVQTVAGRLNVSATGYESYTCQYNGGPPPLGYQPRCLGGGGIGVASVGPLINVDYSGFGGFIGVAGHTREAFSRSLNGTGEIVDQTSLFIWLPLPNPPSSAATGGSRSLVFGDNLSGVRRRAA